MNIKEEYIDKTKIYLKDLRKKLDKKNMLEDEIQLLKSTQGINFSISFENELGIKSKNGYKGIDDLIVTTDSKICCLQAQVERINHYIRMFELYSRELKEIEKNIIEIRYLTKTKNNSFRDIAKKVNYTKSYVARIHDNAICDLAYYIFGEDAIYS